MLSLLAIGALTMGCTGAQRGYDGPARESAEIAVVRTAGVTLEKVNGKKVGSTADAAEVLPGTNSIDFTINGGNYGLRTADYGLFTVDFNAEPGKSYVITGQRGDGKLCVWERFEDTGLPDLEKPAGCISARG
jgi:hypothetical protein